MSTPRQLLREATLWLISGGVAGTGLILLDVYLHRSYDTENVCLYRHPEEYTGSISTFMFAGTIVTHCGLVGIMGMRSIDLIVACNQSIRNSGQHTRDCSSGFKQLGAQFGVMMLMLSGIWAIISWWAVKDISSCLSTLSIAWYFAWSVPGTVLVVAVSVCACIVAVLVPIKLLFLAGYGVFVITDIARRACSYEVPKTIDELNVA